MAEEGFKIAGAYVEVKLRDDTEGDEQAIRARIEEESPLQIRTSLEEPDNAREVRARVEAEPPANLRAALALDQADRSLEVWKEKTRGAPATEIPVSAKDPLDEAWRAKVQASIKSIAKDALKIPMTPETEEYRAELRAALAEIQSATKQPIAAEVAGADRFKAEVEALALEVSQEVKARIQVDPDEEQARGAGRRVGAAASAEAASEANRGMSGMAMLITAGIVAAAPLAGAAITAGVGAGFAGLAIVAAAQSDAVRNTVSQLRADVVSQMHGMTDDAAPYVQRALFLVRAEFDQLAPSVHQAVSAAGPQLLTLTSGINDLAQNAMPGMLAEVRSSGPVFAGLRQFLADTGTAVGGLFSTMSQHADALGVAWSSWGSIVRSVVGLASSLIATLSEVWAAHAGQITGVISALSSTISSLASGALPVLGAELGVVLTIVTDVLHVLEPLMGVLGPMTGAVLAGAAAMKIFGVSLSDIKTFFSGAGKAAEEATATVGGLTAGMANTAGAGEKAAASGGKFVETIKGIGSTLPLVGVAVAVLGAAFAATATDFTAATQKGEDLAKAMIQGGGAADTARSKLNDLRVENERNQATLVALQEEQKQAGTAAGTYSKRIDDLQTTIDKNNKTIDTAAQKYQDIKDSLSGAEKAHVLYNEAVEKYGPASQQAAAAGAAWRKALDDERLKADQAADAVKTLTDRLADHQKQVLGQVSSEIDYGNSVQTVRDKQQALTDAINKHGAKSNEAAQAMRDLETAQLQQADAAGKQASATYTGTDAQEKLRIQTNGTTLELLNMAAASNGHMTPALAEAISKLSATDLAAAGATVKVDNLGHAVVTLPDGKPINIDVNTASAQGRLDSFVTANDGRVIHISTEVSTGISTNLTGGGLKYQARGGILAPYSAGGTYDGHLLTPMAAGVAEIVNPGTYRVIGDNLSVRESYIPQNDSQRSKQILAQTNAAMGDPLGVQSRGAARQVTIHNHLTVRDNDTAHHVAALASAGTAWSLQTMRG